MNLSRRDLLTIFLGAPLAAAACRAKAPKRPEGEIVGASASRGHELRQQQKREPLSWRTTEVAIIGGGPAGLAAAWRLVRGGKRDYEMLELEPDVGGTSRYGTDALVDHPWGAHYINAPMAENRAMITLLEEMRVIEGRDKDGAPVIGEQFLCREPDERVFYRGRWYEGLYLHAGASPADLAELQRFETLIAAFADFRGADGRRAFAIPMAKSTSDPRITGLDQISMATWLTENELTSPRLRWLVDYACRDDYGTRIEDTSAWAGLFYFAARKRSDGKESQPVITWPEGNGRLVRHLHGIVHERVTTGALVTEVRPTASGVDVVAVDRQNVAFGVRAKHAIVAAPHFVAERIVRDLAGNPLPPRNFAYGTWLVSNVHLRERPAGRGFPLSWDNVIYESPSLGYVVATHQRGLDRGPTILTHYFPMCDAAARQTLLGLDYGACADIVLSDLRRAHPEIDTLVTRLDCMRWGHAMVRPKPRFLFGSEREAAATPIGNLCFAHSDLSGVALFEEAFYRGVHAAEAVLGRAGAKSESLL